MRHLLKVSGTAVLCLFIGIIAPAYAQEEHHDDQAKPEQRTEKKQKQQAKSAQRGQQKQEAQQAKASQRAAQKQEAQQAKSAQHSQKQERAQGAIATPQNQDARDRGGRIPDDRFRAHFGRDHAFRINRPVIVSGSPRFRYGGYWFGFGEPWPAGWSYTDQVYVEYIDGGYYLLSPVHPGVQISISVVL